MKWRYLRGTARAYLMSIAFWFGLAFLMGSQYGVLNRQHLWSSFVQLLGMASVRGFALALWTPPIFYLVGKISGIFPEISELRAGLRSRSSAVCPAALGDPMGADSAIR